MSAEVPLSRVRWLCRRGTLELDHLLGDFAEACYTQLAPPERAVFLRLLAQEDDRLWDWMLGQARPEDPELAALVRRIRDRHRG